MKYWYKRANDIAVPPLDSHEHSILMAQTIMADPVGTYREIPAVQELPHQAIRLPINSYVDFVAINYVAVANCEIAIAIESFSPQAKRSRRVIELEDCDIGVVWERVDTLFVLYRRIEPMKKCKLLGLEVMAWLWAQ